MLADLNALLAALASALDVRQAFGRLSELAREVIPHDQLSLGLLADDRTHVRIYASSEELALDLPAIPLSENMLGTLGWDAFLVRDVTLLPESGTVRWHLGETAMQDGRASLDHRVGGEVIAMLAKFGVRSTLRIPIVMHGDVVGGLNFFSRQPDAFRAEQIDPARRIADHVALALAHERLTHEQRRAGEAAERARLLEARIERLSAELDAGRRIIGRSAPWREILAQATKVAATETTVLLTGESGTGKEVVARYIHRASPRRGGPFVAINCAALPDSLLESELFGYEKGAFTGATAMKPGSFDLAAEGILFLDEVGEMSLLVQAKLLRVLEQREFQRLGGTRPVRADLRLVAATNRDLKAAMARGQFREDLYYRLHVFAIRLPPLRERPEDIPPLIEAFLNDLAKAMARPIPSMSLAARAWLVSYSWPGNVRELRNALERALILCDDGYITAENLPLPVDEMEREGGVGGEGVVGAPRGALAVFDGLPIPAGGVDLEAVEKFLVTQALAQTGGIRSRAARLLHLTRAQLYSRMGRHGLQ